MTLQNRVQPGGQITDTPMRGLIMGNRGILHGADKQLGQARWKTKAWISCVLSFKGRKRELMAPRSYTELFFLDEAVAMAAGHRPCFECRRAAAVQFKTLWQTAVGPASRATDMDRVLHAARTQADPDRINCNTAPPGSFVLWQGQAHLVRQSELLAYMPAGYGPPLARPDADVIALTPAPLRAVLHAGYTPLYHPSATMPQRGVQD